MQSFQQARCVCSSPNFVILCFECDLSQLVSVPTHYMGNCLDLVEVTVVLTNCPHEVARKSHSEC